MTAFILAGLGAGAVLFLFATATKAASSSSATAQRFSFDFTTPPAPASGGLDSIFQRVGAQRGVDWRILKAHAMAESNLNPGAVRWNPPRDVSAGLMQILALPPANYSGGDFLPVNNFNLEGWPVTFERLKDPETSIDFGAQIIRENMQRYGWPKAIAVYNNYSARFDPPAGPFRNQGYVDKVLQNFAQL